MSARFQISTRDYVLGCVRRQGLFATPDYSRAVEYPLVSRLLQAQPGDTLLDVGAGRMAEFSLHAAAAGLSVTAIDQREDLGAAVKPGAGIEFRQADATQLPFPDGTFDRIAAISTVEHIEHGDGKAMAELARVLKPGGRLVVSVPYNPLRSGTVYVHDGVYGRTGERVFFEHLYDEQALQERIVAPTGLRLAERIDLCERRWRPSRVFYRQRANMLAWLLFRVPWGWAMALSAPAFLRRARPGDYDGDDWIGCPTVLAFES